jgi:hypothetical protein
MTASPPLSTLALLGVLAFAACRGESERQHREALFREYVAAVNAHDVSKALGYYAPDVEFVIPGQDPIRGTDANRSLLEWDSVMNSRIRMVPSGWAGDTLTMAAGSERNAWFRGIGLDSIRYAAGTRVVYRGDRIKGIYPANLEPGSAAAFQARAQAFFAWAQANAPEVAQLAPGGLFKYDGASAEAWLEVLRRYEENEDS